MYIYGLLFHEYTTTQGQRGAETFGDIKPRLKH